MKQKPSPKNSLKIKAVLLPILSVMRPAGI